MIISWLIYFAVAVASGVFFILYKDLISLILFLCILCVPIFLFIIHFVSCFLTKIEVEVDDDDAKSGNGIKILLKVKNSSPFSITNIKIVSKCKNLFLNTEHDCKFVISATPFSTKVFTYELSSEHIGNVEFALKKAYFYDFFSMFRLSRKLNITKIIPLYPQTVPVSLRIRPNNWFTGEAEKFSSVKAGDDPSQVFNIREYIEGDKLNRIHWKLTSKTDKYMVKEYSLPVSDNVFVYLDLKISDTTDESLEKIDSLIKTFASVSLELAKKSITHHVGWYNSRRNVFRKAKIKTQSDVYIVLSQMFSDCIFTDMPMLERCDFFEKTKYSHVVLMSTGSAVDVQNMFSGFDTALSLTSIVSVDFERGEMPKTDNVRFIHIIPQNEERCLYGIKL